MLARRVLTIPLFLSLTVLLTIASPILLPVAWIVSFAPAFRGAVPTGLFILGYLWCETIGIFASGYLWLRHRAWTGAEQTAFLDSNYRLQYWWAGSLKRLAEWLFSLRFEITGEEALNGPGALMLARHASIADTVIPMVFYAIPRKIRLRYVLKRELLMDPCLDIVGNRLPNYFVDRGGEDTEAATAGVAGMLQNMSENEGLLIYPEGTRFSPDKVAARRLRWQEQPELLEQLDRWPNLLPPRLGGTLAALDANPGLDVIFCAHVGFEGSSHFSTLINGSWQNSLVQIHFWRVPFEDLPVTEAARRDFLFEQWDRMNRWVSLHL